MGTKTVSRLAGFLVAGALLLVGTGCSGSEQDYKPESVTQACQIITEELNATGTSLVSLNATDPATMDRDALVAQYSASGAALDRAAGRTSDEEVREILSTAGGAMAKMLDAFVAAAPEDQTVLEQTKEPMKELAAVTERCTG